MSSNPASEKPDISARLAKACAEQGLTAGQISALSETLVKLGVDPQRGDWEQVAKLLGEQNHAPEPATPYEPHWTEAYKTGHDAGLAKLAALLPGLSDYVGRKQLRQLQAMIKSRDHAAVVEQFRAGLAKVEQEPIVTGGDIFHHIGEILHAMASTGDRRSMWALAWHLRVLAGHGDTDAKTAAQCLTAAEQWETLGLWTRRQKPSWDEADHATVGEDRWLSADKWLQRIRGPLGLIVKDARYTALVELSETPAAAAAATPKLGGEGRKTVTLLDKIGGIPDKDDDSSVWARVKPWRVLLDPLPMAGTFDPDAVYAALRREFPWLEEANRRVAEMIAGVRAGRSRFTPLLVMGDPGIGKTAWALRVAELCELPSTLVSVSTTASSMLISGDEREWSNSAPCLPAKVARDSGVANPVIIIDELEKAPARMTSNAVSVHDALLPILDCNDTRHYYDLFLQGNLNLAGFSWIFLVNGIDGLPAPLLDRLLLVRARRPTVEEIDRRLDDMVQGWVPGQEIDADTRRQALAQFEQTRSLRDMRSLIERLTLQALWQAPGPREV